MSGNDVDLGAIYQAIISLSEDLRRLDAKFEARFAGFEARFMALEVKLENVAAEVRLLTRCTDDLLADVRILQRDLRDVRQDLAGLRTEVSVYHASTVGHGVLISELDERLTRVERLLAGSGTR